MAYFFDTSHLQDLAHDPVFFFTKLCVNVFRREPTFLLSIFEEGRVKSELLEQKRLMNTNGHTQYPERKRFLTM